jgi:hypothetical protein
MYRNIPRFVKGKPGLGPPLPKAAPFIPIPLILQVVNCLDKALLEILLRIG